MADPLPPVAPILRRVRLVRVAAGVLVVLVGLIALVVGGVLTASQSWPSATATVQSCTASGTSRQLRCTVSWMDSGQPRTADVDLGRGLATPGAEVQIRYSGGTTVLLTPRWVGYASLSVGVILIASGGYALLRLRRSRRAPR